jgi:hypothetical protein
MIEVEILGTRCRINELNWWAEDPDVDDLLNREQDILEAEVREQAIYLPDLDLYYAEEMVRRLKGKVTDKSKHVDPTAGAPDDAVF